MRNLLVLFGVLLLSSCFDIREEVWVHRDGSGRLALTTTLPDRLIQLSGGEDGLRTSIHDWFAANPEASLDSLDIAAPADDGTRAVVLHASAASLQSLAEIADRPATDSFLPGIEGFAGDFDVNVSASGIRFEREIGLGKALGFASMAISPSERRGHHVEYIIHLPTRTRSNNADEVRDDGQTLLWKRSLGELLAAPVEMKFDAPLPIPMTLVLSFAVAIAAALIFAWRIVSRKSKQTT